MQVIDASEAQVRPIAVRDVRITAAKITAARLTCVDLLRGLVMILMALDHTRDFFTNLHYAPEEMAFTNGPLFFTRFITHFCAPVFFLLAGVGGRLSVRQGKPVSEVVEFFWTRGLWLVALDLTVMNYAWTFVFPFYFSDVLWALGWSMMATAALIRLRVPVRWIGLIGAGIVATHNTLDWIKPKVFGKYAELWVALHGHGFFWIVPGKFGFFVLFSLIPWVGVMFIGYALGEFLHRGNWEKILVRTGAALTLMFVVLRMFHLYGNNHRRVLGWDAAGAFKVQKTATLTVISFFNTLKYPPSLQFLLMTLGPSLIVLAWLNRANAKNWLSRILLVYGRAPLFFYIVHLYVIHTLALSLAMLLHQPYHWLMEGGPIIGSPPDHYGHGLPFIYAMWALVVALLYLPCKWIGDLKRRHKDWGWLRYI